MSRPANDEYPEFYADYVSKVPEGDILDIMDKQAKEIRQFLGEIPEDITAHRYAAGKWSIKEVAGHMTDTERVFGCRALCFARNDSTPLPGFEQDDYVANAGFDTRTLSGIADEFYHLRNSHITLFRSFDNDVLMRMGTANEVRFTVRSIAYILAGHAAHHVDVIREKYL